MLAEGAPLGRQYRVVRLLGSGGQGEVYEVEHVVMGTHFAAKVMSANGPLDGELRARFMREAQAGSLIDHPNVARVVNMDFTDDGVMFVVMEYLSGTNLEMVLGDGPVDVAKALHIAREVAAALGAAHALGVVHRDVKPSNIFLAETAGGVRVKLMDFGIAKLASPTDGVKLTQTGAVIGTPAYMAPEQVGTNERVDHRADVYALGCVLYEMLTGRPPFIGDSLMDVLMQHARSIPPHPRQLRPDLPPAVAALVLKCLEKPVERRPQSMEMIAYELERVAGLVEQPVAQVPARAVSKSPFAAHAPAPPPDPSVASTIPDAAPPLMPPVVPFAISHRERAGYALPVTATHLKIAGAAIVTLIVLWTAVYIYQDRKRNIELPDHPVRIALHSNPQGAEVKLFGNSLGRTPTSYEVLPGPASLLFYFSLPGHDTEMRSVVPYNDMELVVELKKARAFADTVRPDPAPVREPTYRRETELERIERTQSYGRLSIDTGSVRANVTLDGESIGMTPIESHRVTAGKHTVDLSWGGERKRLEVDVQPNSTTVETIRLEGPVKKKKRGYRDDD